MEMEMVILSKIFFGAFHFGFHYLNSFLHKTRIAGSIS